MSCHGQGKQHHHQMGQGCCQGGRHGMGMGKQFGGFGQHHGMHGHGFRHFITEEEKIEHLEEYRKALENEIKGIDEHIKKIKS